MTTTPPSLTESERAALRARVELALEQVRPALQADGGDATIAAITPEGVAFIAFQGACVGCPSAAVTMRLGIERALLAAVPELTGVAEQPAERPAGTKGVWRRSPFAE